MSEPNQVLWRGIRPTNPPEYIPVLMYKPGSELYYANANISNGEAILLSVPSGYTYHIINLFGSVIPSSNGYGYMQIYDSDSHAKIVLQTYYSDDYKMSNMPVVLLSPLILLANETLRINSSAASFTVHASAIYTKE